MILASQYYVAQVFALVVYFIVHSLRSQTHNFTLNSKSAACCALILGTMNFQPLTLDALLKVKDYLNNCSLHISDYSLPFKFMWQTYYAQDYAIVANCLVFKEQYEGNTFFHFPLSVTGSEAEENSALSILESYAVSEGFKLCFTNVPRSKINNLVARYGANMRMQNLRRWRDYLYLADDFKFYGGKRFSGQRNHVNKFKKLYPNYAFVTFSSADIAELTAFLTEYSSRQKSKNSELAEDELNAVFALLPHMDELGLLSGGIKVDGKIIALCIASRGADVLNINVEKAKTEYEGVYPTLAQEFARKFATDGVKFINREDDAGDGGLRKSKLQYNPVELVDKYDVFAYTVLDSVKVLPTLSSERLTFGEITAKHKDEFFNLEYDLERNKFWGYDWRNDYSSPTSDDFLKIIQDDFKNRVELPLGIFLGEKLIGEVVLHAFGYDNDCEVGVRLLPEYTGFGYASEAVKTLIDYALYELDISTVHAKCFKENLKSKKMLLASGMKYIGEDDIYYRFKRTAVM